jgi:hypothetical protein
MNIYHSKEILSSNPYGSLTRISAILAYLFIGLSALVGVFRVELIKRFSRTEVISYHIILSFASILFTLLHVISLLFDKIKWGVILSVKNIFVPSFGSKTFTYLSLGTISLYLLLIVVLSGIFFVKISRILGHKYWMMMHQSYLIAFILIFIHSFVGSDFNNIFYRAFFVIIFGLIVYKMIRRKLGRIGFTKKDIKIIPKPREYKIKQIFEDRSLISKKINLKGNIVAVDFQTFESRYWYQIYDDTGRIFALYPEKIKSGEYRVEGILRMKKNQIFIEIKSLRK